MALQVWAPFVNNTKNIGLYNVQFTKYGNAYIANDGKLSGCLINNSTDSYFVFTDKYFPTTIGFSCCAWVNITTINRENGIVSNKDGGPVYSGCLIENGKLKYWHYDGTWKSHYGNSTLQANTWYHVAFVVKDSTVKFYVNGVFDGEQPGTTNSSNALNIIGKSYYNDSSFIGKLNDVRIYDHCLTDDDILRLYQLNTFDLVQGSVLFDRCGLSKKIVNYNVSSSGNTYYFMGQNASINFPFNQLQNGEFTMNTWFYKDSLVSGGWDTIFGGPGGFELETKRYDVHSPKIVLYSWNNNTANDIPYNLNQWNMLTMTRTANGTKFYLNGELKQTGSAGSIPVGDYFIGAWKNYNAQNFKGYIKRFSIYARELSAAEIFQLYNAGCETKIIPDGYIRLRYIEATGTQRINTEMPFNAEIDACKIVFKGNNTNNNGMIFSSTDGMYFWLYYYYYGNGINVYADNGSGQQYVPGGFTQDLKKHSMEWKNKHYYIDGIDKGTLSKTYTNTSNNMYFFAWSTGDYPFIGQIYQAEITHNGQKFNFIPVKRQSDGAIGMYELTTNKFYANQGSGNFIGGPEFTTIPQDYQYIEYIGMKANQAIDTGVEIASGDQYEVEHLITIDATAGIGRDCNGYNGSASGYWEVGNSGYYGTYIEHSIKAGGKDVVKVGKNTSNYGYLYINDVLSNTCGDGYSGTYTIGGIGGNVYGTRYKKLEYMKVTKNNVLVRYMYPCYRKSDKKIGMYDIVNGVFYTNIGTGEFDMGPVLY